MCARESRLRCILFCALCAYAWATFAASAAAAAAGDWREAVAGRAPAAHIEAFTAYVAQFAKTYDAAEMATRFALFSARLNAINAHNAEAAAGRAHFTLGVNAFSDWTAAETETLLAGSAVGVDAEAASTVWETLATGAGAAQQSLDWRAAGAVNAVQQQGRCGAGWAFAATAALEGSHAIASGHLLKLAEQQCVDCVGEGHATCASGGRISDCWEQVKSLGGAHLAADYPYTASASGTCHADANKMAPLSAHYATVPRGDETALLAAVRTAPTAVSIAVASATFWAYAGGIYDHDEACSAGHVALNHAMTLVGFGHDAATETKYWILRNSWGTSWGEHGYMRMAMGRNLCGVADAAAVVLPSPLSASRAAVAPLGLNASACAQYAGNCQSCASAAINCYYCTQGASAGQCASASEKNPATCTTYVGYYQLASCPAPPPTCAHPDCKTCTANNCYYCAQTQQCASAVQSESMTCASHWLAPTDQQYCPAPPPPSCSQYTTCQSCTANNCYYCTQSQQCVAAAQTETTACATHWLAPTDQQYCPAPPPPPSCSQYSANCKSCLGGNLGCYYCNQGAATGTCTTLAGSANISCTQWLDYDDAAMCPPPPCSQFSANCKSCLGSSTSCYYCNQGANAGTCATQAQSAQYQCTQWLDYDDTAMCPVPTCPQFNYKCQSCLTSGIGCFYCPLGTGTGVCAPLAQTSQYPCSAAWLNFDEANKCPAASCSQYNANCKSCLSCGLGCYYCSQGANAGTCSTQAQSGQYQCTQWLDYDDVAMCH